VEGYYDKKTGTLRIDVRNIPEFNELIKQADKEFKALEKTINRLKNFEIEFEMTHGSTLDR